MTTSATTTARSAWDAYASCYDEAHTDPLSLAENELVAGTLAAAGCADPGRSVVDLGCGTGLWLKLQPTPPGLYLGLDVSEGMLERARYRFPGHHFLKYDLATWPPLHFMDEPFGAAVSLFGALSHVPRIGSCLEALASWCATGAPTGLIFYTERRVLEDGYPYKDIASWTLPAARLVGLLRRTMGNVDVRGVTGPLSLALARRGASQTHLARVLEVETATIGRWAPDRCRYLMATGTQRRALERTTVGGTER